MNLLIRQFRAVLIACMTIVSGLPGRLAHSSELATGRVGGTVKVVWGQQTSPVRDAKVELMSISDGGREYQATTDGTGRYAIDLPRGT